MLVVGGKDQENRTVSIRDRIEGDLGAVPLAEAIARLQQEVTEKRIRSVAKPAPAPATSNEGENYAD